MFTWEFLLPPPPPTRPLLAFLIFLCGEFLLHIPCWLHFYVGSFSYTSHAGFIFILGVSLTHPMLPFSKLFSGVSLTHPVPASFSSRSFLLDILYGLHFYARSFSYTSHAAFFFSLFSFFGSFCYTSIPCRLFIWVVPLKQPVLPSFLCGEFLLHIPCWLCFNVGSSLTNPVLPSCLPGSFFYPPPPPPTFWLLFLFYFLFLCGELLLHIPCCLHFYGEFLLHITCWLHFYVGSFSYTSRAGFVFILGVSLTHPVLALLFCSEFLLHILYWV